MSNIITNLFAAKLEVQFFGPNRLVKMTQAELTELRSTMKENPYIQEYLYNKETKAQDRTKPTLDLTQIRQKMELRKNWWFANSEGVKTKREAIINLLTENGMDKEKAEGIAKTYDKKRAALIPVTIKSKYDEIMKDAPRDIFTLKEYATWGKVKNVIPASNSLDPVNLLNKGIDGLMMSMWSVEKTMRMASERRKQLIEAHNAEIGKACKNKENTDEPIAL